LELLIRVVASTACDIRRKSRNELDRRRLITASGSLAGQLRRVPNPRGLSPEPVRPTTCHLLLFGMAL